MAKARIENTVDMNKPPTVVMSSSQVSAVAPAPVSTLSVPALQPNRRQFLKALGFGGAAVGIAGLGALSWRASSQGVFDEGHGPAYAAWDQWDQGGGPLLFVRSAILSANPHNSQPWRFRISGSAIELYVDLSRNTGAMDPYRREQHIGLGCALENLIIAAQAKGYQPQVTLLPDDTNPQLIARVELVRGEASSHALYEAIPRRHTHRAPFDTSRSVPTQTMAALDSAVADISSAGVVWISSDAPKRQAGQLIVEAAEAFAADRQQSVDSFKWWRDSWSDIQRFKDGMTIDAAGLSPLLTALVKILPPQTREQNDQAWINLTRDSSVRTAAAFGIVVVRDATDNSQRIAGGRLYQRLHLTSVNKGLAMQPLNTITERIDRERFLGLTPRFQKAAQALLAEPGWEPLMSFRIGYPTVQPPPSPRRPADAVISEV